MLRSSAYAPVVTEANPAPTTSPYRYYPPAGDGFCYPATAGPRDTEHPEQVQDMGIPGFGGTISRIEVVGVDWNHRFIQEEPVGLRPTAGWLEVSTSPLSDLDVVDGYNLSYLREEATGAAFTKDEYEAPLVAFWNRGGGRVAAVSFPLGSEYWERVRAWLE